MGRHPVVDEFEPMIRCQYFKGRMGQCPEYALHRIHLRTSYLQSGRNRSLITVWWSDFIYTCDQHLNWWFEDRERVEEREAVATHNPNGRKINKNKRLDPLMVERDKAIVSAALSIKEKGFTLAEYKKIAKDFGVQWWTVRDCVRRRRASVRV